MKNMAKSRKDEEKVSVRNEQKKKVKKKQAMFLM